MYHLSLDSFIIHPSYEFHARANVIKLNNVLTLNIFTNNVTHNVHVPMNDENIFLEHTCLQKHTEWENDVSFTVQT